MCEQLHLYFLTHFLCSAKDALDLEVEAAGTVYQASENSKQALATLFKGDLWMIFLNTITGTLHWDFVRKFNPTLTI